MKNTLLVLIVILSITEVLAQKNLQFSGWKPGEAKVIGETSIYRAEGIDEPGMITNIGYQSAEQMIHKLKNQAKDQKWNKEKQKKQLDRYRVSAKGGIIQLYIERNTMEEAELSAFTLVIMKNGNEIQRKKMKNQSAKTKDNRAKNQGFFWVKNAIEKPFDIHVQDNGTGKQRLYKFTIQPE